MPTSRHFDECPDFPSDVPGAEIPVISFGDLQEDNDSATTKLFNACKEHGLFLLELEDTSDGKALLSEAGVVFDVGAATLDLDKATLEEFACEPTRDLIGYKRPGLMKAGNGKMDAVEMYTLSQDEFLGTTTSPGRHPAPLEARRADYRTFFRRAHAASSMILARLNQRLDLPPGTLPGLCPLDKPSVTCIRTIVSRPQTLTAEQRIALGGHKDIGALTLLFNVVGGLQTLPPGGHPQAEADWLYVRPRPGCAIVNVGDTLAEWTGGVLRSPLHRVVRPPGAQGDTMRRSMAYLMRSVRAGSMRRLKGGLVPPLADGEVEETRSVAD